ncbi:MAG: HDOD domain-containing protein [Lysobacteraceae bacterium]
MAGSERSGLPKNTTGWAKLLLAQQLPVLARTAQGISECARDDGTSGADLAALILRDAGMTTRVLRLASSRLHNPHGQRIRTVSRAVALLGFDVVREIALGIAVLDVLGGRHAGCAQAAAEAARALRAAVQARALAETAGIEAPEEVFIAALLQDIGHLAFWSAVPQWLPEWRQDAAQPPLQASQRVAADIGLDLDGLSLLLNAELRLSPLLVGDPHTPGRLAAGLARRWVDALETGGRREDLDAALADAARAFRLDPAALREQVAVQARQGDALVEDLFDPAVRALLPVPRRLDEPGNDAAAAPARADPALALDVLRDLAELQASGRPDPGMALSMVMEGLQRAAGFDRVLFALLSPDRTELRLRSVLAAQRQPLTTVFPLAMRDCGRLLDLLAQPRVQDLTTTAPDTGRWLHRLGAREALLGPLVVDGRVLGLLHADRAVSGDAIEHDARTLFTLLLQQANLALANAK